MKSRPIEKKKLREFGLLIGTLSLLLTLWMASRGRPVAVSLLTPLALCLLLFSFWKTGWLSPAYRLWMGLAHVLGTLNSRTLLGLFFYLILTPIGWLRRIIGGQDQRFRFHLEKDSYWIPKGPVDLKNNMRHTF